ncbi:MAG TPA: SWIM zinc finger family protein [Actinocrinis sp.]|nr:SWIM zinc finger family protein [Actinocrinis sp.]
MSWGGYPSSRPRRTASGIRARSARGAIGDTWWSQRFIAVLEGFGMGSRLTRGRSYARSGQVLEIGVRAGEVVSRVQGSRTAPYSVVLEIGITPAVQWAKIERALAEDSALVAELLAGRMPVEMEAVFSRCGMTLFPTMREFASDCSCPDRSSPCKHVAATCYILAERFDANPFELLAWRGRTKTDLLRRIDALRDEKAWAAQPQDPAEGETGDRPLAELTESFWLSPEPLPEPLHKVAGAQETTLLDQLGPIGAGLGGQDLATLLGPAYAALIRR